MSEAPHSYPRDDRFPCPCGGWVVAISVSRHEFWARCSENCDRVPGGVNGSSRRKALDAYWAALSEQRP